MPIWQDIKNVADSLKQDSQQRYTEKKKRRLRSGLRKHLSLPYSNNYTYSNYTIRLAKSKQKDLKTRQKGYKNGRVKDLVWGINITGIIKLYILTEYIVNLMYPYTGLRHG